eukprot:GHRR01035896.1.p1 GENE.GHRR01035896.1~~GHRR01035896.1.p1  ORF type:complete len:107 (+),score=26.65 GHRR01035896.1:203-523(+)
MRDGDGLMGLVDYATADDMHDAIRNLDDSEFRNPFDRCYIRVRKDDGSAENGHRRSPSRSRSPRGRAHSRSVSPRGKGRSVSYSRSPAPVRHRSVSEGRSRSRSAE